ncbi:Two-component transcriptional response regulator, LuxR family [hydrothermal vent metagenome]|uniref:Two-component transcriptional response regulator, LuxR family n=1 Tax=hydrothermal vent metagenome TaxID=652676 RepID=A0A3B0VQG9_9ZZZZ
MNEPITVLIADDHGVVREGLRIMLEREGFRVVAEAATGREAIEQAAAHRPQVVLLDIRMPDLDGLQALSAIKEAQPETAVIILTSHTYPAYLSRAVSLGAAGFLSKEVNPDKIPHSVRAAAEGNHLLDRDLLKMVLATAVSPTPQSQADTNPDNMLTEAELRVLRLIGQGLDNAAIAQTLSLSPNTIKTHVRHIFEKLHVSDRTQAALWAVRHGYA